jgi:hypothetical protein
MDFANLSQVPPTVTGKEANQDQIPLSIFLPHIMIPCYCYHERSFIYEMTKAILVLAAPEAIPVQIGIAN